MMKCLVDHDRSGDHDRHSQCRFQRSVHDVWDLAPAPKRQPAHANLVPDLGRSGRLRKAPNAKNGPFILNSVPNRKESIAVGPTTHAGRRWAGKMGDAHDRGLITKSIEGRASGFPGLYRVVVRHHAEVGILSL